MPSARDRQQDLVSGVGKRALFSAVVRRWEKAQPEPTSIEEVGGAP